MAIHCDAAAYSGQIPLRKSLYFLQHPSSAKRSSARDAASGSSPYVIGSEVSPLHICYGCGLGVLEGHLTVQVGGVSDTFAQF